jgi:hypothetical protein
MSNKYLSVPLDIKTHAFDPYMTKFLAAVGLRKASLSSV